MSKPYFANEHVTLIHGDSRDVLTGMGTESVDLVIADPPYGVNWRSNTRAQRFDELHHDGPASRGIITDIITGCVRVVGQSRHLYIFGPADVLAGQKVSAPVSLIWDKGTMGSGAMNSPWGPHHEQIWFAVSQHRHAGKTGNNPVPARLRKGSIITATRPTGRTVRHPSEKPLLLLRELIESSSRAGETVLDPFAGCGSTGVAAVLTGRKAILVESDAQWLDMAVARIVAATELMRSARAL